MILPTANELLRLRPFCLPLAYINFSPGNPVRQFFRHLQDGSFHPEVAAFSSLCRQAKYKDYLLRQKDHFSQLVYDILPSRQVVLDVASLLPEGVPLKIKPPDDFSTSGASSFRRAANRRRVLSRASLEYYRALAEVRQDVADDGETSSEDEAFPEEAPLLLKARGFSSSDPAALEDRSYVAKKFRGRTRENDVSSLGAGGVGDVEGEEGSGNAIGNAIGYAIGVDSVNETLFRVMDTLAPEVDPISNDEHEDSSSFHPAVSNSSSLSPQAPVVTEESYRKMLKRRKKWREKASFRGDLRLDVNTEGMEMDDVIRRTEISMTADDEEAEDDN